MLKPKRSVVTYHSENSTEGFSAHEQASIEFVARRIARLLSADFGGEYGMPEQMELAHSSRPGEEIALYFVPGDTLLCAQADRLGIKNTMQLFGGCVPHEFIASKCITHPLLGRHCSAPAGWSHEFPDSVRHVTLRGFSAFSLAEALVAGEALLAHGEIRIKAPCARGGNGQCVVNTVEAAKEFLHAVDHDHFATHGVVLEANLQEETTRSIGTVTIGDTQISYCGSQMTTVDRHGGSVYGGSSIRAVRGGFNHLLRLDWSKEEIIAIAQAMIYDAAADTCFEGFFASRRNYDVAQGCDRDRRFCSGVLEQSWRIGGASPAEIAAVEAFARDPALVSVRTSCREIHSLCDAPDKSDIYFRDADADVGHITKFVSIDAHEYGSLR